MKTVVAGALGECVHVAGVSNSLRLAEAAGWRTIFLGPAVPNEAIHNQPGYYGIKAPATLNHRYLFEDVPMSLVPIAALGQRYGVSVRAMDSIVQLACIVHRTDYWRRGRTLDKLGIEQLSVSEITQYVNEGLRD